MAYTVMYVMHALVVDEELFAERWKVIWDIYLRCLLK